METQQDMNTKQIILNTFLIAVVVAAGGAVATPAASRTEVDHSLFSELLGNYVRDGKVDYAGFQSEEAKLDRYLDALEKVDIKTLSRDEQFAFYTNAYNAWTIKLILSKYPKIKSIKSLGVFNTGPWKQKVVHLKGEKVSLDNVEHDILRPQFNDPRVHFAINCAAKSCPPLRSEAFRGETLNQQLEDSTRSFINDPNSYRLDGSDLYVSRIFKWFSEDFSDGALAFFKLYAEGELKEKLEKSGNIQLKYLKYDWSLNGM
jgi:hypothetical protein